MSWIVRLVAVVLMVGVVLFGTWLWRRMARHHHLPVGRGLFILGGGAAGLVLAHGIERWALGFAEVSVVAGEGRGLASALAMIVFCTPLEEAIKAAVVWPLYVNRRLITGQIGAIYAVLAATGFSAAEVIWNAIWTQGDWISVLRVAFAAPAHLFFAGVWGYMLGGGHRDRFFTALWLGSALLHGIYDHIVFGRGPALLVIVAPMLALMAVGVLGLLRETSERSSHPSGRITAYTLFEAPSVGSVREVLSRHGRPVMLHWILLGSFVNLGVTLTFVASSVYFGRRFGVDFSLVDEAGVEGIVPIVLLGGSLLAAFPVSAFLIARASGAASVLEPAWATGASIVVVLALFSVTEPTALVIAMGIAPVGFTLACAGAWFGLDRR